MRFDFLFIGGGLQGVLGALAVLARRPELSVCMIEAEAEIGGNHTWCFHSSDLPVSLAAVVEPLVSRRWSQWQVAFPNLQRTFDKPYAMVTSSGASAAVHRAFDRQVKRRLRLGTKVRHVGRTGAQLDDGSVVEANVVVDARGPQMLQGACGFQKFVGLELELDAPHDLAAPLVIDANVEQRDGFRFFYVLPISPTRVLVEETFFSDESTLDLDGGARSVLRYASRRRRAVERVVREESGVLPLPLVWPPRPVALDGPLVAGYAGGFFHPTTGYSFPIAARVAEHLASSTEGDVRGGGYSALVAAHERQARFGVLLNRLLFTATPPHARRNVLERFHRLPDDVVERFYALDLTGADRLRVVCGAPPRGVSLRRALSAVIA